MRRGAVLGGIVGALVGLLASIAVTSTPGFDGGADPASRSANGSATGADSASPLATGEHAMLSAAEARVALASLTVAERRRGGYDRDLFGGDWTTSGGCTTRQLVLAAEAAAGQFDPASCDVTGGVWVDWYSPGTPTSNDPGSLDVDHFVPLAHAWQAGAWAWTTERRIAFANDLDTPTALTVVSATQNRAKADAPPDAWQPPNHAARCTYAKDWIATKTAWALTVTPAETVALEQMLDRCEQ